MTEILTESFCERCGTRYTFESVAPRQRRLGGIRLLGRGLKNFVLSDDSSLDEAMAAARSDQERDATSQQLDAFHRTFNFCLSCRQYTCRDCWNTTDERCQSCAPLPGVELHASHAAHDGPMSPLLELDAARLRRTGVPAEPADSRPEPEMIGVAEATAHAGAPDSEAEAARLFDEWEPVEIAPPPGVVAAAEPPSAEPDFAFASDNVPEAPVAAEAQVEFEAAVEFEAEVELEAQVEVETEVEAEVELETRAEVEAQVEAEVEVEAQVEAEVELEAAPAAPAAPAFEPGTSLDDAIAAYEASLAQAPAIDEPVVEPAAMGGPGVDIVEQPTWDTRQPAEVLEPAPAPALLPQEAQPVVNLETRAAPETVAPTEAAPLAPAAPVIETPAGLPTAPQWPTGPRWPTAMPARAPVTPPAPEPQPLAAVLTRQATEAMWAASSRDVVQPPIAAQAPVSGIQPCVSCGISLSATARFCRRCGTSQLG